MELESVLPHFELEFAVMGEPTECKCDYRELDGGRLRNFRNSSPLLILIVDNVPFITHEDIEWIKKLSVSKYIWKFWGDVKMTDTS